MIIQPPRLCRSTGLATHLVEHHIPKKGPDNEANKSNHLDCTAWAPVAAGHLMSGFHSSQKPIVILKEEYNQLDILYSLQSTTASQTPSKRYYTIKVPNNPVKNTIAPLTNNPRSHPCKMLRSSNWKPNSRLEAAQSPLSIPSINDATNPYKETLRMKNCQTVLSKTTLHSRKRTELKTK